MKKPNFKLDDFRMECAPDPVDPDDPLTIKSGGVPEAEKWGNLTGWWMGLGLIGIPFGSVFMFVQTPAIKYPGVALWIACVVAWLIITIRREDCVEEVDRKKAEYLRRHGK